jgi:hypothetical protein
MRPPGVGGMAYLFQLSGFRARVVAQTAGHLRLTDRPRKIRPCGNPIRPSRPVEIRPCGSVERQERSSAACDALLVPSLWNLDDLQPPAHTLAVFLGSAIPDLCLLSESTPLPTPRFAKRLLLHNESLPLSERPDLAGHATNGEPRTSRLPCHNHCRF